MKSRCIGVPLVIRMFDWSFGGRKSQDLQLLGGLSGQIPKWYLFFFYFPKHWDISNEIQNSSHSFQRNVNFGAIASPPLCPPYLVVSFIAIPDATTPFPEAMHLIRRDVNNFFSPSQLWEHCCGKKGPFPNDPLEKWPRFNNPKCESNEVNHVTLRFYWKHIRSTRKTLRAISKTLIRHVATFICLTINTSSTLESFIYRFIWFTF